VTDALEGALGVVYFLQGLSHLVDAPLLQGNDQSAMSTHGMSHYGAVGSVKAF
jgi:hypothetical protein